MMANYFLQLGLAFDMFLNALLGGWAGQTISYRAALGMEARKPAWCMFCRLLSWLVQRDHCQDQIAGVPMDGEEYFRALIGLLVLAAILATPVVMLVRLL